MSRSTSVRLAPARSFLERQLPSLGMRYALQVPSGWSDGPVIVAVHGISRNWREVMESFAPHCSRVGAVLLVPRFSRKGYRGYQRLESGRRGVPADLALNGVLEDAAHLLDAELGPLRIFGFSGGAQFVHRYALVHPERVERQALAAAGFYTMPDPTTPYPYGLAAGLGGRGPFDRDGLLLPTKVFVGADDTERDADLRQSEELDRRQGRHRVERAGRFALSLRTLSGVARRPPSCRLEILPGCDHNFGRCVQIGDLARRAVDFLVESSSGERAP